MSVEPRNPGPQQPSPAHAVHPVHPEIERPPTMPPAPASRLLVLFGAILLVLLTAGLVTFLSRRTEAHALARDTEAAAVPTVAVVLPTSELGSDELVLPGSTEAFEESSIFARTNGYLLRWYKDIGSPVKKGDLLASIDTPEVDQELLQARASREQAKAQLDLAKLSADRWAGLRKTDSVSQQEADQQASGYQQALANLAAVAANVRRLEELESFKSVYAPFSGVLIRRNVDPGALINAGSAGKELFVVARVDVLRVYVSVPQAYRAAIKVGTKSVLTVQELPGQKFFGTVARTAQAIDPATRTLRTEVDVPNSGNKLLPGSFGQVHFSAGSKVQRLTVPVNTIIFRAEGSQVALVNQDSKVSFHPITIGRDFGATVEVLGGVEASDPIIINPSDGLEQGQQVHVAQPAGQPAGQPAVQPVAQPAVPSGASPGAMQPAPVGSGGKQR